MNTNKSFSISGLLAQAVFALLLPAVLFTACKQQEPFDTQSPDDAPLILRPYNESGTGSFTYNLANPDTPLFDSVTVTPSRYTTINWYLDDVLIYTGEKINMCFYAGTYALTIEAVTEAGKRTTRTGSVTVQPYDTDPFSAAPAAGRHLVPQVETTLDGQNLSQVTEIVVSQDVFGTKVLCSCAPATATDAQLTFTLPDLEDGKYFIRLKDAQGKLYGADAIYVHNSSVALSGYDQFVPSQEWVITGVKLQNVASVSVDGTAITDLTATATTVTLTAPAAEPGEHTLSIQNADGSAVLFITDEGTVTEVTTFVSSETALWEGSCVINWGDANVKVSAATMAAVPVGATIYVYFNVPDAEYHALRITDDWWSYDLLPQVDGMADQPNPYTFTYNQACKDAVDQTGQMLVTGFGLEITKITFK